MSGENPVVAPDVGFFAGTHPVELDRRTLDAVGFVVFKTLRPDIPFERQFSFAEEIGFLPD